MNWAINKYGWDNVQHNILANNIEKEAAKKLERYYIQKYNTTNLQFGYNRTYGGDAHICKPVLYNGEYYVSLGDFCKQNNLSTKTVGNWLTGKTPMDAYYYDRGLRYENQENQIVRGKSFKKQIICNGIIYESLRDFSRTFNLNSGTVYHWLNGDVGMPNYWYNQGLRYVNGDNSKIKKSKRIA